MPGWEQLAAGLAGSAVPAYFANNNANMMTGNATTDFLLQLAQLDAQRRATASAQNSVAKNINLQDYEAIARYNPDLADQLARESSAVDSIQRNEEALGNRSRAMTSLGGILDAQGGDQVLKDANAAALETALQKTSREARGRNEAIISQMNNRGMGGSGMEFAARRSNDQDAIDRQSGIASDFGQDYAKQKVGRYDSAMRDLGGLASSALSTDDQYNLSTARAKDEMQKFYDQNAQQINMYNTNQKNASGMADWENRQNIANSSVNNRNEENRYARETAARLAYERAGLNSGQEFQLASGYNNNRQNIALGRNQVYQDAIGSAIGSAGNFMANNSFGGMPGPTGGSSGQTRWNPGFSQSAMDNWNNPNWWSGSAPAREYGGPVEKGREYLVGENGAEKIVPTEDGVVIPGKRTAMSDDFVPREFLDKIKSKSFKGEGKGSMPTLLRISSDLHDRLSKIEELLGA